MDRDEAPDYGNFMMAWPEQLPILDESDFEGTTLLEWRHATFGGGEVQSPVDHDVASFVDAVLLWILKQTDGGQYASLHAHKNVKASEVWNRAVHILGYVNWAGEAEFEVSTDIKEESDPFCETALGPMRIPGAVQMNECPRCGGKKTLAPLHMYECPDCRHKEAPS